MKKKCTSKKEWGAPRLSIIEKDSPLRKQIEKLIKKEIEEKKKEKEKTPTGVP